MASDLCVTWQAERHLTFEDPKGNTAEASGTSAAADEWLAAVAQAIDTARALGLGDGLDDDGARGGGGYQSAMSSSTNTLDLVSDMPTASEGGAAGAAAGGGRHTLQKMGGKEDEPKGFKRFSKRQSRNGLAAVF